MDWADLYARMKLNVNDASAWDALERRVRAWATEDLGNRGWAIVDDTVADTCASVILGFEKARGAATFAGFVRGHYMNVRRRMLARLLVPTEPLGSHDAAIETDAPDEESLRILERCVEQLPPREHEAVRLRFFEEACSERIASALGISVVNARRVVFNGVARLRRCVHEAGSGGRR